MEKLNRDNELIEIAKQFEAKNNIKFGEKIGGGGYGIVLNIKTYKDLVAKLIKKEKNDEVSHIFDIIGPNITKIVKICDTNREEKEQYHLIIMEKANLKDLYTIRKEADNKLFNFIINSPFEGLLPDNLIRYYCYEIIKGLETLDRTGYSHFDIKPENILIFNYLKIKLSDFSFLKSQDKKNIENGLFEIPGGTKGYISPEFYENRNVPVDVSKKQDCFALGSTIYYLKYGRNMLDHPIYDDGDKISDCIMELLQRAMDNIKSKKSSDQDFIDFLCSLISYKPNDRPIFEEIYRNKWLNKNIDKIKEIYNSNFTIEGKLIIELYKSDYLMHKKKELKKVRKKFSFNNNKYKKILI